MPSSTPCYNTKTATCTASRLIFPDYIMGYKVVYLPYYCVLLAIDL